VEEALDHGLQAYGIPITLWTLRTWCAVTRDGLRGGQSRQRHVGERGDAGLRAVGASIGDGRGGRPPAFRQVPAVVRRTGRCRRVVWQEHRSNTVRRHPASSRLERGTNPEFMGMERETGLEPATACLEGRHLHLHRLEAANPLESSTSHHSTVYGRKHGSCQGF
jgi:hypothetical protein